MWNKSIDKIICKFRDAIRGKKNDPYSLNISVCLRSDELQSDLGTMIYASILVLIFSLTKSED